MSCYCDLGWPDECDKGPECSTHNRPLGQVPEQRSLKDSDEVSDPKSTGRKRAVLVKPITEGMLCEWTKLKNAGGGIFPIVGCLGNPATNVHHGPDKNTLNNNLENLHRICSVCHNRWHTRNDPTYSPDIPGQEWVPNGEFVPHDSETLATTEDILKSEAYWASPVNKRKLSDERVTGSSIS